MNSFTIRDIENLCGIKAHTLRIWEQRYQLICPRRRPGNHRMYDKEDLKYLLRIAYLYHNGHKISTLARLTEKKICQLTLEQSGTGGSDDIFINQLTELATLFPGKEIVVSGCVVRDLKNTPPQVRPLRSLEEMHVFAGES